MDAQPYDPGRKRSVWFSPLLLAVALSPVFLQTSTVSCKTGDTTLSELAVIVGGQNQITFVKTQRSYDVWLPLSTSSALVRARPTDPKAQIWVDVLIGSTRNRIMNGVVGGGEVTIPLQPALNTLQVWVRPPGGASGTYNVAIQVGCSHCADGNECTSDTCDPALRVCLNTPVPDGAACDSDGTAGTCMSGTCDLSVFACTEQGIRDAIARGGGPYRFACDGPTTVATADEIVIDNDVILDGEGKLTVQGSQERPGYHRVFSIPAGVTVQLVRMTITGGGLERFTREYGAGILTAGTLTLRESSVVANGQVGACSCNRDGDPGEEVQGGGIYNTGVLTLESSDVSGNFAYGGGAGIYSAGVLTLESSNVSGNSGWRDGVGIHNAGVTVVTNSVISDNHGVIYYRTAGGSGIHNSGSLTVADSRIERNVGLPLGGGIDSVGGTVTVTNSTISGNFCDYTHGGGGLRIADGTLTLNDSVVSNNSQGGEILCDGTATAINTTISGVEWLGFLFGSGTLTLISSTVVQEYTTDAYEGINFTGDLHAKNSLFVGQVGGPDTCTSPIISEGGNIESPGNTCGLSDPTDLVNVTAAELSLGPLADNGGPTMTYALLPGSVAIDRIPQAMCVDAEGQPLTTDQRGVARPQGAACDVGAFEFPACTTALHCDDGNECTVDQCDTSTGSCVYTNEADGMSCDSGGVAGTCENGACKSWGTPVLIGADNTANAYTALAADLNGNVTAVWSQADGVQNNVYRYSIYANRYTPRAGWGTAELIEASEESAARHYSPEVAVDPGGNVTAVWSQSDGVRYNIYANRYTPGGGWGTAELVGGASDTESAYTPRVAVDPDGNVTVIWSQYPGIYANRYVPGGGWGVATRIDRYDPPLGTGSGNILPDVAVDLDGNAIAVWIGRVSSGGFPRRDDIWANRYTPGGGWGVPELIEMNDGMHDTLGYPGSRVRVAVDLDGNATAVWNQSEYDTGTGIWSNRYTPGEGWGVAEIIQDHNGYVLLPVVGVDASGNVVAVWQREYFETSPHSIWASRYTPSGGWGISERIETDDPAGPGGGGFQPELAVSADGHATAIWRWSEAFGSTGRTARYTAGAGWGAATMVGTAGFWHPQVAVDARGDVTLLWSGGEDSPGIWASRFE